MAKAKIIGMPKLSILQKEIIKSMRGGKTMWKNVTYFIVENGSFSSNGTIATFFALLNKGLIAQFGKWKQGRGIEYRLTELGKSIEL